MGLSWVCIDFFRFWTCCPCWVTPNSKGSDWDLISRRTNQGWWKKSWNKILHRYKLL